MTSVLQEMDLFVPSSGTLQLQPTQICKGASSEGFVFAPDWKTEEAAVRLIYIYSRCSLAVFLIRKEYEKDKNPNET